MRPKDVHPCPLSRNVHDVGSYSTNAVIYQGLQIITFHSFKCEELGTWFDVLSYDHECLSVKVRNTAGGFVFAVSDETRVRRFIILGTAGGTYYSSEKELTIDNIKALIDVIERGEKASDWRIILVINCH